jgi:hypothetical protein
MGIFTLCLYVAPKALLKHQLGARIAVRVINVINYVRYWLRSFTCDTKGYDVI